MNKFQFILSIALGLKLHDSTITGQQLVPLLNQNGYLTNRGTQYKDGRGVFRLISAAYDRENTKSEKTAIAEAFTNEHGEYPYEY